MLSIERCNAILKANNLTLSNDEIKQVRDYLYFLAGLQIEAENNNENKHPRV